MTMTSHQARTAQTHEWLTPPEILRALGEFDLDPCAPVMRPWPMAREHYTIRDNGLLKPWHGRVWLNPPFGDKTGDWLARMVHHNNGIALLPARTETKHFQQFVFEAAEAVCFLKKRPHFHYVDGRRAEFNSGVPMVLVAYDSGPGTPNTDAVMNSGLGFTVKVR
jgi:hypothetical protein